VNNGSGFHGLAVNQVRENKIATKRKGQTRQAGQERRGAERKFVVFVL